MPVGEPEPWSLGSADDGSIRSLPRGGTGTADAHERPARPARGGRGPGGRAGANVRVVPSGAERASGQEAAWRLLDPNPGSTASSAGGLGQLAPSRAKELELRGDVVVAELKISELRAHWRAVPVQAFRFTPLARFPSVTRDLAVVADRKLAHGEIASALLGAGKEPLLANGGTVRRVHGRRAGEKIAADKKSLAYSLTYRAEDRTLRIEEVNAAHVRLKAALQEEFQRRSVSRIMNVQRLSDGRNSRTVLLQQIRRFSVGGSGTDGAPVRQLFTLRCSR